MRSCRLPLRSDIAHAIGMPSGMLMSASQSACMKSGSRDASIVLLAQTAHA